MSDKKNLVHLTNETFKDEIADGYTFVDFWADWCGPCKLIAPIFEKMSDDWDGKIKFAKLDTDANQEIAMEYEIRSIPSLILFKDGEIVKRLIGALPEAALEEFLNDFYQPETSSSDTAG